MSSDISRGVKSQKMWAVVNRNGHLIEVARTRRAAIARTVAYFDDPDWSRLRRSYGYRAAPVFVSEVSQ